MKTLQEEWIIYRDHAYPDGCSAIQNKECHQAFCAGALVALQDAVVNAKNPSAIDIVKAMDALRDEAMSVFKAVMVSHEGQN